MPIYAVTFDDDRLARTAGPYASRAAAAAEIATMWLPGSTPTIVEAPDASRAVVLARALRDRQGGDTSRT